MGQQSNGEYPVDQWWLVSFKKREDDYLFMSTALFLLQHIG
jgi:hypothetical protein